MKYTESHEWIKVEDGIGTVGVSHHAQQELGDIVYVELPQVGKNVKAGQEAAVLESTKAAADVYSPVSGLVFDVNAKLSGDPALINKSPEGEGWIFKIQLSDSGELNTLIDRDAYLAKVEG